MSTLRGDDFPSCVSAEPPRRRPAGEIRPRADTPAVRMRSASRQLATVATPVPADVGEDKPPIGAFTGSTDPTRARRPAKWRRWSRVQGAGGATIRKHSPGGRAGQHRNVHPGGRP